MSDKHDNVTTQLTSKSLKLQSFLSATIFWIGLLLLTVGSDGRSDPAVNMGTLAGAIGGLWWFITKVRIWWNHS